MSQRWDPIRDLVVLQDRMNRLFEDATERRARNGAETREVIDQHDWVPAADFYEDSAHYVVALDLPGVDRETLELELGNSQLAIRGNRSMETRTEHRSERPRGKFARVFAVPPGIDQERVEAEYKDGVLYVRLGKRQEPTGQRVTIKVS